jgi:SAM-dependent methyltransferase/fructosamine-3-kinase
MVAIISAEKGMRKMSAHCCPECLGDLDGSGESLRCSQCSRDYPVIDGVPLLSRGRDFYYGEVPRDVMRAILARATTAGWQTALLEHADSEVAMDFYDYSAPDKRAGFKFLLDHFESGVVLDYGCGLGANAQSLARNFSKVYATDLTLERAQFTRIRAHQENLPNVNVFCCGDTPHIPLKNQSVDVVVLDGVLEWLPESWPGEPRSAQIGFLKELRRILKDEGCIFIGIENRVGYGYFLGKLEEHTRLRFASLLPRRIANLYSNRLRGRPFRTYTYTRWGYDSLLQSAGFSATDYWGLIPDYREIEKAVLLQDSGMIREALNEQTLKKRVRNFVLRATLPWMVDSFGILAGEKRTIPYIEELAEYVAKVYLGAEKLKVSRYALTATGTVHVHLANHKAQYILKLPLSARSEQRLEAAGKNIEQLETVAGVSLKELLVSKPIACAQYRGQTFVLEEELSGQSLDNLVSRGALKTFLPRACDYLALLCERTLQPTGEWGEILGSKAREYGLALAEHYRRRGLAEGDIETDVLRLADYVSETAPASDGFRCAIHGDFWHGNIMVAPQDMRITALLDWDSCEMQSLPFLDLFNFMTKHAQEFQGHTWGSAVVRLRHDLCIEAPHTAPLRDYARQIRVDKNLMNNFLIVYWIRQCLLLLRRDLPQAAHVLNEAISQPLNHFRALLKTRGQS